jgi:predicted MPP superfamily phosphohydrolase
MISRGRFLRGLLGLSAATALTGIYTWQVEPYWVEEVQLSLPIRSLPTGLAGRKVVQLSDLHLGDRFDWRYMIAHFERIEAILPDFVVYTGDLVSYDSPKQFEQLSQAIPHFPKGRLGTAAILGNHDYGHGWAEDAVADEITSRLMDAGITVLRNAAEEFAGLYLVGLDDFWGTNYAPHSVLARIMAYQPTIVLCHNPDVLDQKVWGGYQGWILSGHTHGGQVKPPFLPPPIVPVQNKAYIAGKIELNDGRILYINRGLGHLWPVRFNVRPEVTIFTLKEA